MITLAIMDLDLALRVPKPATDKEAFRGTMSDHVDTAKAFLKDLEKRFDKNEKAETSTILAKLISMRGYKFYDPMTKSIFETGNARFFEDVEFVGGERLKDFVFEEEYVDIPLIAMENDQEQFHIPDIIQEATPDQDNVIDPRTQPQEVVPKEQTLQPQEP
ncbi:hypothetical protein GH714_040221 [Hevea brasiliensis]|uniref:Uncharacterized protein n=1 Tax=Hevea brasiliensis TaxID=3981 RepID=A0A6A6MPC3_HEVBR|nr:hypothetical protein GH714_040221 [Hevea brasiliensis]